jgi:uncharacterized protein YecT (DUF1311 family)
MLALRALRPFFSRPIAPAVADARRFLVFLLLLGLLWNWCAPLATSAESSTQWVLSYQGKSTNRFVWDKRTATLIRSHVPPSFSNEVLDGLGGPPDPVFVVDGRYVSVSACVPHYCLDKGFFWFDSQTGIGLGAYFTDDVLRLGSSSFTPEQLPVPARQAVLAWLGEQELAPKSVQFVSRTGQRTALPRSEFTPPARYRPAEGGPSFDCQKAATRVEATICTTPSLAAQDLELSELVRSLHRGHDTIAARDELRDVQRKWLRARDQVCRAASDIAACLGEQYRAQNMRLMNWVPTK